MALPSPDLTADRVHEIMHLALDRIYEATTIEEAHGFARRGKEKFGDLPCFKEILEVDDVESARDLAHRAEDIMMDMLEKAGLLG